MDPGPPVCIGIPLARKPVLAVFLKRFYMRESVRDKTLNNQNPRHREWVHFGHPLKCCDDCLKWSISACREGRQSTFDEQSSGT